MDKDNNMKELMDKDNNMKEIDEVITVASGNFKTALENLVELAQRELRILAKESPYQDDVITSSHMDDVIEELNVVVVNSIQFRGLLELQKYLATKK